MSLFEDGIDIINEITQKERTRIIKIIEEMRDEVKSGVSFSIKNNDIEMAKRFTIRETQCDEILERINAK